MSLDKIYYRLRENDFFLDCTRLDGSKKLVSRRQPNDLNSVESQIRQISIILKNQGKTEIVLVDDVVFSGSVLRSIINFFEENRIRVIGIRASISTEEAYDNFNQVLKQGLKSGCVLGKSVIDQICERDFYFGIAQSGISVKSNDGKIFKAPYFKPYGDPVKRASIPKEFEIVFSNNCLLRSMFLWKCMEDKSKRKFFIKDLPEEIINTDKEERIINVLRKGLMSYEKDTNRNYGECR